MNAQLLGKLAAKLAETTHTHSDERGEFDVSRLFALLANRPVESLPIDQLRGLSRSRRSGFSPVSRLSYANTEFPVLVEDDDRLFDGRHRVLKQLAAGQTRVQARRVHPEDLAAVKLEKAAAVRVADLLSLLSSYLFNFGGRHVQSS